MIPIFESVPCQMTVGERAALNGVLGAVKPSLAVEIGTAEGGSLRYVARHSARVLSFDLVPPAEDIQQLPNVEFHTGDSHVLLPEVLSKLASEGRNVDFVLVDGDHTTDGVAKDLADLLDSNAIRSTVVLFHDTMNDHVRAGLSQIDCARRPDVIYFDLDFVAGRMNVGGDFHHQLWGGLGLMIVDEHHDRSGADPIADRSAYNLFELVAPVRDALVAYEREGGTPGPGAVRGALSNRQSEAEITSLREELMRALDRINVMQSSKSWRWTAPLRSFARTLRGRHS